MYPSTTTDCKCRLTELGGARVGMVEGSLVLSDSPSDGGGSPMQRAIVQGAINTSISILVHLNTLELPSN